ncbi:MAG: hypothetical protein Unbinned7358contig1000_58 [Prokaryotic dsDNA virus sp.]|nr:MAG: hypothetical protein Unbinned7358contig1000_58 [Prokaryotic dsDNA virus sp.]
MTKLIEYLRDKRAVNPIRRARARVWVGQVAARLGRFGWSDIYVEGGPADLDLYLALHDLIREGVVVGPDPYGSAVYLGAQLVWRATPQSSLDRE